LWQLSEQGQQNTTSSRREADRGGAHLELDYAHMRSTLLVELCSKSNFVVCWFFFLVITWHKEQRMRKKLPDLTWSLKFRAYFPGKPFYSISSTDYCCADVWWGKPFAVDDTSLDCV
jgi:hypothetical protein